MPNPKLLVRALLPFVVVSAAAAQQGTPIAAIPFDSLPAGTQVVSSTITLDAPTVVHGDVQIDSGGRLRYSPALSRKLQVAAHEFASAGGTSAALEKDGYLHPTAMGLMSFVAPVRLPDGAQITNLYCHVYDNDQYSDFVAPWVELRRRLASSVTPDYLTAIYMNVSGTSAVMQTFYPTNPFATTVDEDYTYYLWFSFLVPGASGDLRFYGCTIDYDVSVVSP